VALDHAADAVAERQLLFGEVHRVSGPRRDAAFSAFAGWTPSCPWHFELMVVPFFSKVQK